MSESGAASQTENRNDIVPCNNKLRSTRNDITDNLRYLSESFVKQQQSTCNQPECLSCKIISYCVSIGFTGFGLTTIKRHPIPGLILAAGGFTGLVTFVGRDIKRYRSRPPEW